MSGVRYVQFDLSTALVVRLFLGGYVTQYIGPQIKPSFVESLEGSAKSILSTLRFQVGAESKIEIRQCTPQTEKNLAMYDRRDGFCCEVKDSPHIFKTSYDQFLDSVHSQSQSPWNMSNVKKQHEFFCNYPPNRVYLTMMLISVLVLGASVS